MVALKMIKAGAGARLDDLARFEAEARAVAAIDHPNIIKIFEIGERDGLPYFSLEFLEGGSLADRIDGKPQPIDEAARIVETLARALDVAHRRGIVHRDIKPANILLAGDGTPKIADFGLVKRLEANSTQTGTGSILGSPSYMAPEQATGTEKVGPAADQYALGATLYEMLTGRPPFRGSSIVDTLDLVRTAEPVAPSRLLPRMPRDLETICLKGAAKGPGSTLSRRRGPGRGPPAIPRRRADRRPSRLRPRAGLALVPAQPASRVACSNGGPPLDRHGGRVDRGLPRAPPVEPGTGCGQHHGQESPHRGRDRPKTRRRRKEAGRRRRAGRHPAEPRSRRGPARDDPEAGGQVAKRAGIAEVRRDVLGLAIRILESAASTMTALRSEIGWPAEDEELNWRSVGLAHQRIGEVRMADNQLAEADKEFRINNEICERAAAANPENLEHQNRLVKSCRQLGAVRAALVWPTPRRPCATTSGPWRSPGSVSPRSRTTTTFKVDLADDAGDDGSCRGRRPGTSSKPEALLDENRAIQESCSAAWKAGLGTAANWPSCTTSYSTSASAWATPPRRGNTTRGAPS